MERLVIFFAFIVLILMIETTDGNPSCAEDNTAYYGNNLVNARDNKKGSSTFTLSYVLLKFPFFQSSYQFTKGAVLL